MWLKRNIISVYALTVQLSKHRVLCVYTFIFYCVAFEGDRGNFILFIWADHTKPLPKIYSG